MREVSVDRQMVRVEIGERGGIVVGAQIKAEKVGDLYAVTYEPRREKTSLQGFRPGPN